MGLKDLIGPTDLIGQSGAKRQAGSTTGDCNRRVIRPKRQHSLKFDELSSSNASVVLMALPEVLTITTPGRMIMHRDGITIPNEHLL